MDKNNEFGTYYNFNYFPVLLYKVITVMGKKCIPGMFCIENMTLFILIIVGLLIFYAFYKIYKLDIITTNTTNYSNQKPQIININNNMDSELNTNNGAIDNGIPPQNIFTGISLQPRMPILRDNRYCDGGVPINIETRPSSGYRYSQIGMLEKNENGTDGNVLPLMGRRLTRNKWQYYAVSNTHLNIKLPVKINGKSGSQEYGCDELITGDTIFVVGYGNYIVSVYDGANFHYL